MINIKNLTLKNFLSVGNVSQAIDFSNAALTLVLGENLDISDEAGSQKNGTGKCQSYNTMIKIRNKLTGEIIEIAIGDLYEATKEQIQCN